MRSFGSRNIAKKLLKIISVSPSTSPVLFFFGATSLFSSISPTKLTIFCNSFYIVLSPWKTIPSFSWHEKPISCYYWNRKQKFKLAYIANLHSAQRASLYLGFKGIWVTVVYVITIFLYSALQENTDTFPLPTLQTNGWDSKLSSFNSSLQNPMFLLGLLLIISTLTKASFLVSSFSFFCEEGTYFIDNPHVSYFSHPFLTFIY